MKTTKRMDAGEIRELIVERYGQVLTYGGAYSTWRRGMRWVMVLSRLTGLIQSEILRTVQSDYQASL